MIIYQITILLATIIGMVFFHELGHWAVARELGGEAVIKWGGLLTEITGLSKEDQVKAYWGGVIGGLIPIMLYSLTNGFIGLFAGAPLLLWYVWFGCNKDFKAIKELRK